MSKGYVSIGRACVLDIQVLDNLKLVSKDCVLIDRACILKIGIQKLDTFSYVEYKIYYLPYFYGNGIKIKRRKYKVLRNRRNKVIRIL